MDQFSGPILEELLSRIATIETKAISILGWSTALLGFLLFFISQSRPDSILKGIAIGAAIVAVLSSSVAARARSDWRWPTIDHWFCIEHFDAPTALRVQHLRALIRAYEAHSAINNHRSAALKIAQIAIASAGLLVALAAAF